MAETRHEYYFHAASGTVQWEHPTASLEEPAEAGHASNAQAASAGHVLAACASGQRRPRRLRSTAVAEGGHLGASLERAGGGGTASPDGKRASMNMIVTPEDLDLMSQPTGEQISAAASQEVQALPVIRTPCLYSRRGVAGREEGGRVDG